MQTATRHTALRPSAPAAERYARCIEVSRRIRWDIERDVIRGRIFDTSRKFMPDGLSKVQALTFLSAAEKRFLSQVQGRTYANMFALVERFIGAKASELGRAHAPDDPLAFEALVRLADEEQKHRELFRRLERMQAAQMPSGYEFRPRADEVAAAVLSRSTWAVLALTLDIEAVSQSHWRASIEPDAGLSELWKDVFLFHWREESQHAIVDELEWRRADARLTAAERDAAVDDFIGLIGELDRCVQVQAAADADYFVRRAGRAFGAAEEATVRDVLRRAYRWQHIVSGAQDARFAEVLAELATDAQLRRIGTALAPIVADVERAPAWQAR